MSYMRQTLYLAGMELLVHKISGQFCQTLRSYIWHATIKEISTMRPLFILNFPTSIERGSLVTSENCCETHLCVQ